MTPTRRDRAAVGEDSDDRLLIGRGDRDPVQFRQGFWRERDLSGGQVLEQLSDRRRTGAMSHANVYRFFRNKSELVDAIRCGPARQERARVP